MKFFLLAVVLFSSCSTQPLATIKDKAEFLDRFNTTSQIPTKTNATEAEIIEKFGEPALKISQLKNVDTLVYPTEPMSKMVFNLKRLNKDKNTRCTFVAIDSVTKTIKALYANRNCNMSFKQKTGVNW